MLMFQYITNEILSLIRFMVELNKDQQIEFVNRVTGMAKAANCKV